MSVKQKIVIDVGKTFELQVVVRDETGLYNPSNPDGYGGNNGNPVSMFNRYIFDMYNKNTNYHYRQIHSDNENAVGEFLNPAIVRIANKENVYLNAANADINSFPVGVYSMVMSVELKSDYGGDGFVGQDNVVNVSGAQTVYDNYNAISANGDLYKIRDIQGSILILDRAITTAFTSFKPVLQESVHFVINDQMEDLINKKIASYMTDNDCNKQCDQQVEISKIQLYNWGLNRAIAREDYNEAYEYMECLISLCNINAYSGCR